MSQSQATANPVVRTYSHWRKPSSAGLGKMGLLPTIVIFATPVLAILFMMLGAWPLSIGLVVIAGIFVLLTAVKDRHDVSTLGRLRTRGAWWRTQARGQHVYRSGPLGRTPGGTNQLPGLAARSRLWEAEDSYGRRFAMIEYPATGHYVVAIRCQPEGEALVDTSTVDDRVGQWGNYLAAMGQERGLVGMSVTVESAPDTGFRLRREIDANLSETASPLSRAVMTEIRDTWPQGSASIRGWITLTFSGKDHGFTGRQAGDRMAHELATRLPALTHVLSETGAGVSRPASADELCEQVRVAYDPAAAALFDDARSEGESPALSWSEVGPTASQAAWDHYVHDGAVSASWVMSHPPRGLVTSRVLGALMAPHAAVPRKRVTMLYRPYDAATAATMVENDDRDAQFRTTGTRPSARARKEARDAARIAEEEAAGAGIVDFAMIVTATVPISHNPGEDELAERLQRARAAVGALASAKKIMLRPAYGGQDVAFAAGLPLGLVLPTHVDLPRYVRELL